MTHDFAMFALVASQLLTAAALTRWECSSRQYDRPRPAETDPWPDLIRSL